MLNLDPAKLLVIAVVAIILLGPDRLPNLARQVGGAWRTFNEYRHRMETEVRNSMPDLPSTTEIARLARSPSALLNHLSNMSGDDPTPSESAEPPRNDAIDDVTRRMHANIEKSPSNNLIPGEVSKSGDPGLN
jgi:TatA/E family protein of Tat protein translocase